jgi:hypothetical protein
MLLGRLRGCLFLLLVRPRRYVEKHSLSETKLPEGGQTLYQGNETRAHSHTVDPTLPKAQVLTTSLMTRSSGRSYSFIHSSSSSFTYTPYHQPTSPQPIEVQLSSQRSPKPRKSTNEKHRTPHIILHNPSLQQRKMLPTRLTLSLQRRIQTNSNQPVNPRNHHKTRPRQSQERASGGDGP